MANLFNFVSVGFISGNKQLGQVLCDINNIPDTDYKTGIRTGIQM